MPKFCGSSAGTKFSIWGCANLNEFHNLVTRRWPFLSCASEKLISWPRLPDAVQYLMASAQYAFKRFSGARGLFAFDFEIFSFLSLSTCPEITISFQGISLLCIHTLMMV